MDKPIGFSSFQVVRMMQRRYRKIGHAGTLDPFASGLLIVLTDRDTKRFRSFEACDKEYSGEIILGVETDTYDISGSVVSQDTAGIKPAREAIEHTARQLTGTIQQVPPRYSALKRGGRKLYELSRKGINVELNERTVVVKSFSICNYDRPVVSFRTVVGKGVYVRSLAHDIGRRLGTGATLLSLRRERIGQHHISHATAFGALLDDGGGDEA